MAAPVRLNAVVSGGSAGPLPEGVPPSVAPSSVLPVLIADGREPPRADIGAAPSAPTGLSTPTATKLPVRTQLAPANDTPRALPYRTNDISAEDAAQVVAESERVLRSKMGLGFAREAHSFRPVLVFRDQLVPGEKHARMQRLYNHVPIYGEQVVTHIDRTGNIRELTNMRPLTGLKVDVKPTITADEAFVTARKTFAAEPQASAAPELLIVKDDDGTYRLAWEVVLEDFQDQGPRRQHYFVDAHSGEPIFDFNEIHGFIPDHMLPARAPGGEQPPAPTPAPESPPQPAFTATNGIGRSIYDGIVELPTARRSSDGLYVLRDPTRRDTETRDNRNQQRSSVFDADGFPVTATVVTDTDNAFGMRSDDVRASAAVDAHAHTVRYDDYLKDMYGRNGIDGAGMRGRAVVHVGKDFMNAIYMGGVMWFGDGDPRISGPLVDKDVAAHEPTHGLTANTSGLIYRGESGALNEAASDIIGAAGFSWYRRNWARPAALRDRGIPSDYTVGEDAWTPGIEGDALRYMSDPSKDRRGTSEMYSRDHYSQRMRGFKDNGGVHFNSGIANNFFYLLANGGTNRTSQQTIEQGIGMEKALRIFYRAHTTYFTPFTTFAQAREACIKAASDLYGADSTESQTVARAWSAVGVEAPPAPPAP